MNQAETFFNCLYEGYQSATQVSGNATQFIYQIGGKRVAIFRPMFSSTLMQIPSADSALLHGLANVLRQLACYRLELGESLEQTVDCLRTVGIKP